MEGRQEEHLGNCERKETGQDNQHQQKFFLTDGATRKTEEFKEVMQGALESSSRDQRKTGEQRTND